LNLLILFGIKYFLILKYNLQPKFDCKIVTSCFDLQPRMRLQMQNLKARICIPGCWLQNHFFFFGNHIIIKYSCQLTWSYFYFIFSKFCNLPQGSMNSWFPSFLVFYYYLRGYPDQFACATTNPTAHRTFCKPSEHVRHHGGDKHTQ
jgi:hypothetical protein